MTFLRFNVYGALGKQKYSEESVSLCELAHHKRQKEWSRLEPESPGVSTTTISVSVSAATILYSPYVFPRVLHVCADLILLCMPILTAPATNTNHEAFHLQRVLTFQVFCLVRYCLCF